MTTALLAEALTEPVEVPQADKELMSKEAAVKVMTDYFIEASRF